MTRHLLTPGDTAPDFTAPTDTSTFSLSEHRGATVILFFYPAAMTPGCTTQACDFRDSLDALKAHGYQVVGISKDAPEVLAQFRAQEHLQYTLVSDEDLAIQNAYGAWGQKNLYGKLIDGTIRTTIVIGPDGVVTHAFYNVKATGHVGRLRRDLGIG
ncbi:thioredoxin-dependent thiol peroxidase [Demequina sp.]|uniref:thioredoxin-dependent thiol peroxidase n=1 Tax=Demequina sp. TaxID=2050685 RepID=UPI003D0FE54C